MPDNTAMVLLAILSLPCLACLAIVLLVPGIETTFITAGLEVGAVLVVGAVALSYGASALAARSEKR